MKVTLIGPPGSGKSTLAIQIGALLAIPVHHLDVYLFSKEGEKRGKKELEKIHLTLAETGSWVIEGCSIKTLETRFTRSDLVIYLKVPRLLCIWRLIKRALIASSDLSETGCAFFLNRELLRYVWNFYRDKGPKIESLKEKYPNVDFRELKTGNQFIKEELCRQKD